MGVKCCHKRIKFSGENNEGDDIHLKDNQNYISLIDNHLKNFENTYNLVRYLDLYIFTDYIFKYNEDNTSIIKLEIDEIRFNDFVDKKIIDNPIITIACDSDDDSKEKFKEFLKGLFLELQNANQQYKNLINENVSINSITKINLFAIGFILCESTNQCKLNQLFYMFSQRNKIKDSKEFKEFIFLLLSLNSSVYYWCLKKFYNEEEFLKNEEITLLEKAYNVNNILDLCNTFVKDVFKNKAELTEDEFEKAMTSNIWIFYGNFIRWKLENKEKK